MSFSLAHHAVELDDLKKHVELLQEEHKMKQSEIHTLDEQVKSLKTKLDQFEGENESLKDDIVELAENLAKERSENKCAKETLVKVIETQKEEIDILTNQIKVKNGTVEHLNRKLLNTDMDYHAGKDQIKVLEKKNDQLEPECQNMNTILANDKKEFTDTVKSQKLETDKLERTHNILKELFENQQVKYFNLLISKELLEEEIQTQVRKFKNKASICDSCEICKKMLKTRSELKKHKPTIFCKEC